MSSFSALFWMSWLPRSKALCVSGLLQPAWDLGFCNGSSSHCGLEGPWPRQEVLWASPRGKARRGLWREAQVASWHRCFLPAFTHWSLASPEGSEAPVLQSVVILLLFVFPTVGSLFGGQPSVAFPDHSRCADTLSHSAYSTAWPLGPVFPHLVIPGNHPCWGKWPQRWNPWKCLRAVSSGQVGTDLCCGERECPVEVQLGRALFWPRRVSLAWEKSPAELGLAPSRSFPDGE